MKRWQRKRTRWGYAVDHSKHLEKLWAFRDFVRGVVVLKRQRLHMELMMRKAVEFMVDGRLARVARIIKAMREYADNKIAKRERRKRIFRRALELWTNRAAFSVLRRCPAPGMLFHARLCAFHRECVSAQLAGVHRAQAGVFVLRCEDANVFPPARPHEVPCVVEGHPKPAACARVANPAVDPTHSHQSRRHQDPANGKAAGVQGV
jgi:hypothetical protein